MADFKFGEVVMTPIYRDSDIWEKRIYLGTREDGKHLLVHGGEEEYFYSDNGGAITFWADVIEKIEEK